MTDDLAALPFHDGHESPPVANGAKGAKPCRRHDWHTVNLDRGIPDDPGITICARCGKLADPESRKRGRSSLRAGKEAERAIARAYGGTRTGQYGGPDDVVVEGLFVIQSKAGGWFSERVWSELAKLPRTGGRIPTLVVSDRPGPGHRTRRYVVRTLDDDLDLHGPGAA